MQDPIVKILLRRREAGTKAPHRDGASVALCVEGGAMRGVISAGMVSALEHLGLTHAFDAVYGSSGGAINAAYFLAGQARVGSTIYFDDINNARFIDPLRPLRGRSIVDLGFLLDDVAIKRKPLDVARLLRGVTPLAILATDVVNANRAVLRGFRDARGLFGALRAGATMPIIAGEPFRYDGRDYLDASLTEPIPVPSAQADGHTHILTLLTRPTEHPHVVSAFDHLYVLPRLRRLSPILAKMYVDRGAPYRELVRNIDAGGGPASRAVVRGIRPHGAGISKLERRRDVLMDGADRGFAAVVEAFQKS